MPNENVKLQIMIEDPTCLTDFSSERFDELFLSSVNMKKPVFVDEQTLEKTNEKKIIRIIKSSCLQCLTLSAALPSAAFWTTQLRGPATSFSVRWRFIYVNGTLRRDITKPLFLALRASFTETLSVRLSRLPESAEK